MKLRKLNQLGVAEFNKYLDELENDGTLLPPKTLLSNVNYSEDLKSDIDIESKIFKTRFDAANYLHTLFSIIDLPNLERDTNLWAWCTLYFFDVLCPVNNKGLRIPRERAAYIPEPENYQRYYRHLLLGPYLIYRVHGDDPSRA